MAATRPPFDRPDGSRPNFPNVPCNSGSRPANTSYLKSQYNTSNNGISYGNPNSTLNNRFYAPPYPPRPPQPPQPVSFIRSNYSEPPLPPGTSEMYPPPSTQSSSIPDAFLPPRPPPHPPGPIMNADGSFAPLIPPPLPPLFPYLSQELAKSLHDGAQSHNLTFHTSHCGTSFVDESTDLPFIPVIIDDNDLKKMTESVKTQFEETRQQNLLLYEDIIDPSWPKELRDMFQPLYCKLCKLTLSSPVVARDHYKGKRHIRAAEVWIQNNPSSRVPQQQQRVNMINNKSGPISGTMKTVGGGYHSGTAPYPHEKQPPSFRGNGPAGYKTQDQYGYDRSPAAPPPPPSYSQSCTFKRNARGENVQQPRNEFIPAYRAALAPPGPNRKKPKKEGGGGPNFGYCSLCDVHHTSAVTAEQHYSGKNHKAKLTANPIPTGQQNQNYDEDSSFGNFSNSNNINAAIKQGNINRQNNFSR